MNSTSQSNGSPLLLLLDGVLCQDEESTGNALIQLEKLDPSFNSSHVSISPLRSASTLEKIVKHILIIKPHLARVASESDNSLPLHFAASIGNIKVASLLLEHHRDAALTHNSKGKIPLHYAAREGGAEMVRFLLQQFPTSAKIMTEKGKLPLHFACIEGHIEVVRDLLRVYPSAAEIPSKTGKVALHFAARWGHLTIARDLCRLYPPCIDTLDYEGSNPLHEATRFGQFGMTKFIVERCPSAMEKLNIRGEIPLFAGIRSGNIELCAFLIQAWPESGKQVLQALGASDDVSSWEPEILNMCLRGAVGNFTDLSIKEKEYTDDHAKGIIDRINTNGLVSQSTQNSEQQSGDATDRTGQKYNEDLHITNQQIPTGVQVRSKSPILGLDNCGKKRCPLDGADSKKRQRCRFTEKDTENPTHLAYRKTLEKNTFLQVHAALECSATINVLKCVLDRYPEQTSIQDDYGRLPLHIAISHCRSKDSVDFILERIWKPHQGASFHRDYFNRLPLHLALMTRADSRFVEVLLQKYPSSGVEPCDVVDEQNLLPIHMATTYGCDLSTLFLLVRSDPAMVQTWSKCHRKSLPLNC